MRRARVLVLALAVVAAVGAGLASAWASLKHAGDFGIASGPWRMSLLTGSPHADMHTRARVALGALLALERRETMYYMARTDSTGARLRSRCSYRITGTPPAARWWSITAYADDFFLFPDALRRYSLNGSTAPLDAEGRFMLESGPKGPVVTPPLGAPQTAATAFESGTAASVETTTAATAAAGGIAQATSSAMPESAARPASTPWLPTPGDRGLIFTLRVYQPAAALGLAPHTLASPRIEALAPCA